MHAGQLLTSIREEMGLKSAQFARHVGASAGQMYDWENGNQRLTIEAAVKIERALGRAGIVDAVVSERTAAAQSSDTQASAA